MKHLIAIILLLLISLQSSVISSDIKSTKLKAEIFKLDSDKQDLLYFWEGVIDPVINEPIKTFFYTPSKNLVAEETIIFKDSVLQEYRYTRYNTKEFSSVLKEDHTIIFTRNVNGTIKKRVLDLPENFVCGPLTVTFIRNNFDPILNGQTLVINYAVLDHLRTVEFIIFHDTNHSRNNKHTLVVKMIPKNFIIRQFVEPLYFLCNSDGTTIREIIGRIVPVNFINGKTIPIDAEFIFN